MLELYVVIRLLEGWALRLQEAGWPLRGVRFQSNKDLITLRQLIASARGDKGVAARQKLKEFNYMRLAIELLSQEFPPEEFEELKYVLFRCPMGISGKPLTGKIFLEEVLGRLNFLYFPNVEAFAPSSRLTPLARMCTRDSFEQTTTCLVSGEYAKSLQNWRRNGIWVETARVDIYKRYQKSCLGKVYGNLVNLSEFNLVTLENEVGDDLDEAETAILNHFLKGSLYFKHATFSSTVIFGSGMMLCPELSISEGVSERNGKYAHNKYVFGRLEFTDEFWESRFGDERILFEIGNLDDTISISLHDQEQPFAKSKESEEGHTQVIRMNDVVLRQIHGDEKQQQWNQWYNGKIGDGAVSHSSSFVQEVFVGQFHCRLGMALSLIRELRRMEGRGSEKPFKSSHVQATRELKQSILRALNGKNFKAFQNIFKMFFRVEIRVPAFIDLTQIGLLRHMDAKKTRRDVKFTNSATFVPLAMEQLLLHRILTRCQTLLALAWADDTKEARETVKCLISPCIKFFETGSVVVHNGNTAESLFKKSEKRFGSMKLALCRELRGLNALLSMGMPPNAWCVGMCLKCGALDLTRNQRNVMVLGDCATPKCGGGTVLFHYFAQGDLQRVKELIKMVLSQAKLLGMLDSI